MVSLATIVMNSFYGKPNDASQDTPPGGAQPKIEPPPPYDGSIQREIRAPETLHGDAKQNDGKGPMWHLGMLFLPEFADPWESEWTAKIELDANDLTYLMRQGLHWTEANIQKEKGYFTNNGPSIPIGTGGRKVCWANTRVYSLVDTSDQPQWSARFEVASNNVQLLSEFRLRDLNVRNVSFAAAMDKQKRLVYYFDKEQPWKNSNAIYDDMPMDGWWPWPRRN